MVMLVVVHNNNNRCYCKLLRVGYFQASSLETKQLWVKRLRELIQDRLPFLNPALCDPLHKVPSLKAPTPKLFQPNRNSRSVSGISFIHCLPLQKSYCIVCQQMKSLPAVIKCEHSQLLLILYAFSVFTVLIRHPGVLALEG